jgi:hypothetical protein
MIDPPLAHGGVPGAIAEGMVALAVIGFFAAAWLRERSARRHRDRAGTTDEPE